MYSKILGTRSFVCLVSLLVFACCVEARGQKLKPQEIIAKHRESIGTSEVVANAKRRMAIGSVEFVIRSTAKTAKGRAVLASDGIDMAFFSAFDMQDYPMERIGIFGNKISIPIVNLGRRSPLGTFLTTYDKYLNDRIFGGCVFSTWLFLGPESSMGKLETEGKKKVGDRDAWVVKYTPKGGLSAESYIRLYFDAKNFHHLRTVYRQKETENGFSNTAPMSASGTPYYGGRSAQGDWNADMASNGSTITEDYDDIREVAGLTLPHKYSIVLNFDSAVGSNEFKWILAIAEYRMVKDFPPEFFSFNKGEAQAR